VCNGRYAQIGDRIDSTSEQQQPAGAWKRIFFYRCLFNPALGDATSENNPMIPQVKKIRNPGNAHTGLVFFGPFFKKPQYWRDERFVLPLLY
jgi:hypothetical protein